MVILLISISLTVNVINFICNFYFSRQAGHRLCNHINRIMVLLEEYSQCDDDELREFCIQACEAFVQRCPEAISDHIPAVSCQHNIQT